MRRYLLMLALCFSGCTHSLKNIEDVRINQEYPVLGSADKNLTACTLKAENVATVEGTKNGGVPFLLTHGTQGLLCGPVDCSKAPVKIKLVPYMCVPFEIFLEPTE